MVGRFFSSLVGCWCWCWWLGFHYHYYSDPEYRIQPTKQPAGRRLVNYTTKKKEEHTRSFYHFVPGVLVTMRSDILFGGRLYLLLIFCLNINIIIKVHLCECVWYCIWFFTSEFQDKSDQKKRKENQNGRKWKKTIKINDKFINFQRW